LGEKVERSKRRNPGRPSTETSCRVGIGSVLRGGSVTPRRKPYVSCSYGPFLAVTGAPCEAPPDYNSNARRVRKRCCRHRRLLRPVLQVRPPASWAWTSPPAWPPAWIPHRCRDQHWTPSAARSPPETPSP